MDKAQNGGKFTLEALRQKFPHIIIETVQSDDTAIETLDKCNVSIPPAAEASYLVRPEGLSRPPTSPPIPSAVSRPLQEKNILDNSEIIRRLDRIEEKVERLRADHDKMRASVEMSMDRLIVDCSVLPRCEIVQLITRDQLNDFEHKLGRETAFADEIVDQLKRETAHCDAKTRIVRVLDALFSRPLFAECSWTGVGRNSEKIPFCSLRNVLLLLRRVACVSDGMAPAEVVESIVRSRLYHATERLTFKPGRKAYCKLKKQATKTTNSAENNGPPMAPSQSGR